MRLLHASVATSSPSPPTTLLSATTWLPLALLLAPGPATGQFPPRDPQALNLTAVQSPINDAITVSYKTPGPGACRTAFDHQQQYTGWVNVPSGADGGDANFETNLFFWFVEAREPTSALTIWLNGGPGSSSLYGFFTGNGPCEVVEKGADQLETVIREWGWDRASNMLFIDQVSLPAFALGMKMCAGLEANRSVSAQPGWILVRCAHRGVSGLDQQRADSAARASTGGKTEGDVSEWHL
jgi:hypothetical protein